MTLRCSTHKVHPGECWRLHSFGGSAAETASQLQARIAQSHFDAGGGPVGLQDALNGSVAVPTAEAPLEVVVGKPNWPAHWCTPDCPEHTLVEVRWEPPREGYRSASDFRPMPDPYAEAKQRLNGNGSKEHE